MDFKNLGKKSDFDFSAPDPDILETFENPAGDIVAPFLCHEFTSICPVTGQPDFAKIEIVVVPDALGLESKSLKLFLNGFRNFGAFHEKIIADIGKILFQKLSPKFLRAFGDFSVRGGIAIKPLFLKFSDKISATEKIEISEKIKNYDRIRHFDF